jgi:glycosyltransferase involved in cell wall biosynthesis
MSDISRNDKALTKRLVIFGLGLADTGLGRVLVEIVSRLKVSWEVTVVLQDADGSFPHIDDISVINMVDDRCKLFKNDVFNNSAVVNAECILIVGQPWKCIDLIITVKRTVPTAKIALYLPIEGKPYGEVIVSSAALVDICIVYTKAMHDQLSGCGLELAVIGHGCDQRCRDAGKVSDRQLLRQHLFPNHPSLWKNPLVLNSNRMYFRKRFDLCLAGFSKASKRINANLYLHIPNLNRYEEKKLRSKIIELNIDDRVFLNLLNKSSSPIPFEQLILLMQSSEVGITTAMGEGWGLGSFEHAATGAAQIVPDHIGFKENWGNGEAITIPCDEEYYVHHEAVNMFPPSVSGISTALVKMFEEPGLLELMSRRAFDNANSINQEWDDIGCQFDFILSSLLIT